MTITINGKTVQVPNDNCSISVDKDNNIVITNNDGTTTIIVKPVPYNNIHASKTLPKSSYGKVQ